MQKITPFLWYDGQARYGDAGPGPKGSVMSATFTLDGMEFYALNGGPHYKFTPAISLFVGLTDKYGVSWQVIPRALGEMLNDPDPAKSQRVMKAMLQMQKIDIAGLRRAYQSQS